jgi:hypothetical protein
MAGNQELLTLQQKQRLCQEVESDPNSHRQMATRLWSVKLDNLLHPLSDGLKCGVLLDEK